MREGECVCVRESVCERARERGTFGQAGCVVTREKIVFFFNKMSE